MKRGLGALFIVLAAFYVLAQDKPVMAVMSLKGTSLSEKALDAMTGYLRDEFKETGRFDVVSPERMDQLLKMKGFAQGFSRDTKYAIEVFLLVGVDKIVVGRVDKMKKDYWVDISMINSRDGKVEASEREACHNCTIDSVFNVTMHNVVRKVSGLPAIHVVRNQYEPSPPVIAKPDPEPTIEQDDKEYDIYRKRKKYIRIAALLVVAIGAIFTALYLIT